MCLNCRFCITGKMSFLVELISFSVQVNAIIESASPTKDTSFEQLKELALDISEEVWWLFAFLTAKDDASVESYIAQSLVSVSSFSMLHYFNLESFALSF